MPDERHPPEAPKCSLMVLRGGPALRGSSSPLSACAELILTHHNRSPRLSCQGRVGPGSLCLQLATAGALPCMGAEAGTGPLGG